MNKKLLKDFAVEVMIKPLPELLADCVLAYEAMVVGGTAICCLILAVMSKFKKN